MRVTASKLRENVYTILDHALQTGAPVEIIRHGKVLKIVPEERAPKRSRRRKHSRVMIGNPEDFVHVDWLHEWSELK